MNAKKIAYNNRYNKSTYLTQLIRFNKNNQDQKKAYDHVKSQPNKNKYLLNLIINDMKGE